MISFDNQTPEDTKQFLNMLKEFLEQEYGKDNLLGSVAK